VHSGFRTRFTWSDREPGEDDAMKWISVLATITCAVAACGGGGHTTMLSSAWAPPSALQFVPANTPYFMVSLDDASESLDDFLFGDVGPNPTDLMTLFPERPDKPLALFGWQLVKQLVGKPRAVWWGDLGFKPHGHYMVYGLELWPVVRIELADPARTRAAMERAMAGAGRAVSFGGVAGWQIDQDVVSIAVAVTDGGPAGGAELVATFGPTAHLQDIAQRAISGRPAQALTAAQIRDIANRHHVATATLAVIDTRQVIAALASIAAAFPDANVAISQDCERDAERVAALMPRYVIGYSKVTSSEVSGRFAIELAPALASGLDKLHVAMPALAPRADSPLMTLQVAIDLDAAVAWLRGATALLAAEPFTCSELRDINDDARQLHAKLAEPLPEPVRGIHGFQMVLDDATITPPSGTGYALIAGNAITTLLEKVGPIPGLGPMLPGGGKPIALPTQALGVPNLQAYFGATMERAVVAVGADSSARVSRVLEASASGRAPLLTLSTDYRELVRRLPDAAKAGLGTFQNVRREAMTIDVADESIVFDFQLLK
jgi:hypothetical protein